MANVEEKCPLCGSESDVYPSSMSSDGKGVNCELCGRFEITHRALHGLKSQLGDKELIPYLICHTRQASERGEEFNVVSHTWREFARAHKDAPFSHRVAKLLDLLAARSRFRPGDRIKMNLKSDWPLVDASSEAELGFLVEFLLEENYVNKKFEPSLQLNAKAWERFEKLGTGQGVQGRCFVAMSYDSSLTGAYDHGIFPALKNDCKMTAIRLDREQHNEKICDKIAAEIRMCQFLIADVTLGSENVYFEAGFAMGLGRPVIWSCADKDFEKDVRFDTRQYPYIRWTTAEHLRQQLADRIKATIPGAL